MYHFVIITETFYIKKNHTWDYLAKGRGSISWWTTEDEAVVVVQSSESVRVYSKHKICAPCSKQLQLRLENKIQQIQGTVPKGRGQMLGVQD